MLEVQKQQNIAFKMSMDVSDSMHSTSTLINIRKGSSFSERHQVTDLLGERTLG